MVYVCIKEDLGQVCFFVWSNDFLIHVTRNKVFKEYMLC